MLPFTFSLSSSSLLHQLISDKPHSSTILPSFFTHLLASPLTHLQHYQLRRHSLTLATSTVGMARSFAASTTMPQARLIFLIGENAISIFFRSMLFHEDVVSIFFKKHQHPVTMCVWVLGVALLPCSGISR